MARPKKSELEKEAQADVAVRPDDELEAEARKPVPVDKAKFNPKAVLPFGCTTEHVYLVSERGRGPAGD